ncbi:YcxB family protein [Mucilaginibacter paludis]|uniref:YcxB-like C-terminal domain-containing protein n=1 Tax=Mucilaginibacter paludis DSM 18603 TaxID=714943 RepID=H1YFG8_9SPHI|nr:YcxB family protein [Mucilaginibacter paludis]EHQ27276.1 hypothetical protein Mucpa_3172 [Mucilaginibacter paludis DSM 18603]
MNSFTIQSQLLKREYLKLHYQLMFARAWMLCMCVFAGLFIVFSTGLFVTHNYAIFDSDLYYYGLMVTIWTILIIIIPLITVPLSFKSNQMLQEATSYEFTEEGVNVTGESFTSLYKWAKIYKIKGVNGWILLYQSHRSANIIKVGLDNGTDIRALKDYLKQSGFKIKIQL